jgi:hypothetical protein
MPTHCRHSVIHNLQPPADHHDTLPPIVATHDLIHKVIATRLVDQFWRQAQRGTIILT